MRKPSFLPKALALFWAITGGSAFWATAVTATTLEAAPVAPAAAPVTAPIATPIAMSLALPQDDCEGGAGFCVRVIHYCAQIPIFGCLFEFSCQICECTQVVDGELHRTSDFTCEFTLPWLS